jgi:hypothetical protein
LLEAGLNPVAGTTITIIGGAGVTLTGETFPLQIRANTKITTSTGGVSVTVPQNAVGFKVIGNNAALVPDNNADLTIIGNDNSGPGVQFNLAGNASASIQNVSIQNAGDDGIQVNSGTVNIGRNVKVTDGGNNNLAVNGMDIGAGTVNISNNDMAAPVLFDGNHGVGIDVHGNAILKIAAVKAADAATSGAGSVILRGNFLGNLRFKQTPGSQTNTPSQIDALVVFGTPAGANNVEIGGGSSIKVRNSIVLNASKNGILISDGGSGAPGKVLDNIDLGNMDNGNNVLQAAGGTRNDNVGVCLDITAPTGKLSMIGNKFSASDCRLVNQPVLILRANCDGAGQDIGLGTAAAMTMPALTAAIFDVVECTF